MARGQCAAQRQRQRQRQRQQRGPGRVRRSRCRAPHAHTRRAASHPPSKCPPAVLRQTADHPNRTHSVRRALQEQRGECRSLRCRIMLARPMQRGGVPCALILAMCSRIFATSRSSVHAAMRFSRIAGPRFLRICTPSENVSRRELRVLYLRVRAHASRAQSKAHGKGECVWAAAVREGGRST